MLSAVLLREARIIVPSAWREATVRAALATADHAMAAGVVSAAAKQWTREVLDVMLLQVDELQRSGRYDPGALSRVASAVSKRRSAARDRGTDEAQPASNHGPSAGIGTEARIGVPRYLSSLGHK